MKNKNIVNAEDYLDDLIKDSQNNFSENVNYDNNTKNVNLTFPGTGTQDLEFLDVEDASCSEERITRAYKRDELVQAIMMAKVDGLQKLPGEILKKIKLSIGDLRVNRYKLYIKKRLYILDNNELKVYILWQHHDPPEQGHPGYKTVFWSMQDGYFWPNIAKNCKKYAVNCDTYRRTKAYNVQKQGLLNLLPIPNQKWIDLLLNFVVKLSKCCWRNKAYQHILVIVNRLTK